MRMMTAKIRRIRSDDLEQADKPADIHEGGREPVGLGGHLPFNDNARAGDARADTLHEGRAEDATEAASVGASGAADARSPSEILNAPLRTRRRGPLVTRWIGFAAQRRQARDRVSQMRNRMGDLESRNGSDRSDH